MLIKITANVLRVAAVLALILGIVSWVGLTDSLVPVHMILGIIVVLSLWVLGAAIVFADSKAIGLAIGAFVLGLLVLILGLTQRTLLVGSAHWVVQVIHLLFGLAAIGFGEMIGGRYRRQVAAQVAR